MIEPPLRQPPGSVAGSWALALGVAGAVFLGVNVAMRDVKVSWELACGCFLPMLLFSPVLSVIALVTAIVTVRRYRLSRLTLAALILSCLNLVATCILFIALNKPRRVAPSLWY